MDHEFHTPGPIQLYVEVGRGTIRVDATDAAAAAGTTTVHVEGKQADQVVVTHDDNTVSVVAPKHRFGFNGSEQQVHVTVTLPTGSDATLRSGSADIRAAGVLDSLAIKSGSGDVAVARVHGRASIETGSGDVTLEDSDGELRVKSGSGDVQLGRIGASASISTGSGDVTVHSTAADVAVKTGSGDLDVAEAGADVSMSTGSGDASVRRALRGRITVSGASGDVRVGVPAGTPVWTDISTLTGRIRSDLAGAGEPSPGQDHIELRAKTASGDIELVQL